MKKPTAQQAAAQQAAARGWQDAALAFLRSRPRVGEGSLKIWCGRQKPPLPVYQAEDALAVLVARGLATLTTDQRTGNRSWSAVAPATVDELPEPTPIDPSPAKPRPARKKPAPIVAETCPDCGVGLAGYVCRCEYPEPTPAPEAPAVTVSPLASEPEEPEPTPPPVSDVRAVELPVAEVIAVAQQVAASESVAVRRALGALLVKVGQVLAGEHVTPPATGAEPEGLSPQQRAVWRALLADESLSPMELQRLSGVGRSSLSGALRALKALGLAHSPRYGLWRRAS